MVRRRLVIAARAILFGWIALLLIRFLLEGPLLILLAPLLGGSWFPTVRLTLDSILMAATGWITGRLNRPAPVFAVLVFAATLAFWDLSPVLSINVPWLLRSARDALSDSRYFDAFITASFSHVLLFGSLIVGGLLSRAKQSGPISVVGRGARDAT